MEDKFEILIEKVEEISPKHPGDGWPLAVAVVIDMF